MRSNEPAIIKSAFYTQHWEVNKWYRKQGFNKCVFFSFQMFVAVKIEMTVFASSSSSFLSFKPWQTWVIPVCMSGRFAG